MNLQKLKKQGGFTLIELMIVVAIISILATLALPRFQVFQAKALRSEASYNLGVIATYQEAFRIDRGIYAAVAQMGNSEYDATAANPANSCNVTNDIGFQLTNCAKVKYNYLGANPAADGFLTFLASAHSDKVITGEEDCLTIDNDRNQDIAEDAITSATGTTTCGL